MEKKKLLLCIDDDQDDLDLLEEAVKEINKGFRDVDKEFRCIQALSGQDGLKVLENTEPDFIFLDINMPGMGGLDVLKEIRLMKHMSTVPVMMLSTSIPDAEGLKIRGATACLTKPCYFSQLVEGVRRFFSSLTEHQN